MLTKYSFSSFAKTASSLTTSFSVVISLIGTRGLLVQPHDFRAFQKPFGFPLFSSIFFTRKTSLCFSKKICGLTFACFHRMKDLLCPRLVGSLDTFGFKWNVSV